MSVTQTVKTTAPAAIKLIEGESAIKKALESIKTRGASLQRDIHVAACSVLSHVGKHKDVRLVTKLLESMPDMSRKNALKAWFEHHGPVAFSEKGEIKYAPENRMLLGNAMAKPFWVFKPEAAYVPMDVAASFDSFIKKLEKDHKETGRDHTKLVSQLLNLRPADDSERTANNAETAKVAKAPKAPKVAATAPVVTTPEAIAA
jgi:hypothetical protein